MNNEVTLYLVQWGKETDTGRGFNEYSKEFVWATNEAEAQQWGEKLAKKSALDTKVSVIWAAATTDNQPTPPGLETYQVVRGKKL